MQQIAAHPSLRKILGEQLSPAVYQVDESNLAELTERLKELGIWPRLRGVEAQRSGSLLARSRRRHETNPVSQSRERSEPG